MTAGSPPGNLLSIAATQPRPCWSHPPAPVICDNTGVARYYSFFLATKEKHESA